MKRNISSLILVFILLLFWQGAAMGIHAAYILPSPTQILVRLWELRTPLFLVHLPATMGVTALGLCISVVLGLLLAISMDWNPRLENALPRYHCIPDDSHNGPCAAVYPLVWLWHLEQGTCDNSDDVFPDCDYRF